MFEIGHSHVMIWSSASTSTTRAAAAQQGADLNVQLKLAVDNCMYATTIRMDSLNLKVIINVTIYIKLSIQISPRSRE